MGIWMEVDITTLSCIYCCCGQLGKSQLANDFATSESLGLSLGPYLGCVHCLEMAVKILVSGKVLLLKHCWIRSLIRLNGRCIFRECTEFGGVVR